MKIHNINFTQHPHGAGWFVGGMQADCSELEKLAMEINDREEAEGYFAICGCLAGDEQHRLYLVPDDDPVQVARGFEVGAKGGELEEVIDELTLIDEENPIVPFFADCAGFKFKFKQPLTEEFLSFLDATLSAGVDEQMLDDDGEDLVRKTGIVHLWWD